ncbi:MAG: MATE family efflux transporter [Methanobrevibacter sp.]|nr:MATE family efflux transporter [Methanobrevibacter sp.]
MYERNYELISSKFREFFFPTLLTSMTGNICMVVDSIIVSNLIGAMALSAIQPVIPVGTTVNLIYWMIGLGGSVLCSIAKAEFDNEKSSRIFSVSIISLLLFGILVAIFGTIFAPQIVPILCASPQVQPLVYQYYSVYVLGMPFLCYIMSLSYFIRTDGIADLPFRALLLSNIVNIIFDLIFIGVFHLGVSGAAWATIVGYIFGCTYMSTYFFSSKRTLDFALVKAKTFLNTLANICKSGFSGASTQLYMTIKIFVINTLITLYIGQSGLAAFNICYNSLFILYMFLIGTAQTMSPIVSVYYQEEDYSSVRFIMNRSLKIVLTSSLILSVLLVVCPQILTFLFHIKNPADMPVVLNAVRIFALSYVGIAITFLYTFYSQAIQKNKLSNSISLLEGFIFPVGFACALSFVFGANGIWISFTIAEVLTILYLFIYSRYINRKTNGEYTGFFINKHNDDAHVFEHTLSGNIDDAVGLSRDVQNYLKGNKSSTLVSLAIEEMIVNIIKINDEVDSIDVIVRDNDDNILISIKDTGIDFNPVIENENLEFDNISVLNKIADHIDYSRVLGLNSTVITINK